MFRDWYHMKTREAAKSCWFGSIALVPLSIIAAIVTWWVIFIVMAVGPRSLFGFSFTTVSIICWIVLPITFVWQFNLGRKEVPGFSDSDKPLTTTELAAALHSRIMDEFYR